MDEYTAMEESYKNGYDKGYADAKAEAEAEICILKQKRVNIFERLDAYEKGRAAGVKEFAERLKEKFTLQWCGSKYGIIHSWIDNLVKEMVGGGNG